MKAPIPSKARLNRVADRVAQSLGVPTSKQPRFRPSMVAAIEEAWRSHERRGRFKGSLIPRKTPTLKLLQRLRDTTPQKAAELLTKESPEARQAWALMMCATVTGYDNFWPWVANAPSQERNAAIDKAEKLAARNLPDAGRTPGTPGNPGFDMFVGELYFFAASFWGSPRLVSRKGTDPAKGPLVTALEILRPVLPKGFIPADQGSILKSARRAKESWEKDCWVVPDT